MVPVVLVVLVFLILLALIAFGLTYVIRRASGAEPVGQRVTRRAQHVQEIKLNDHRPSVVVAGLHAAGQQKPLPDIPSFTQQFRRRDTAAQQGIFNCYGFLRFNDKIAFTLILLQ